EYVQEIAFGLFQIEDALVQLGERTGQRQPDPCPGLFLRLFQPVKGLEYLFLLFVGYDKTVVPDLDVKGPVLAVKRQELEKDVAFGIFDGVTKQIVEDLLDGFGVYECLQGKPGQFEFEADILFLRGGPEICKGLAD